MNVSPGFLPDNSNGCGGEHFLREGSAPLRPLPPSLLLLEQSSLESWARTGGKVAGPSCKACWVLHSQNESAGDKECQMSLLFCGWGDDRVLGLHGEEWGSMDVQEPGQSRMGEGLFSEDLLSEGPRGQKVTHMSL